MDTWKIKFIKHVRELIPFDACSDVLDFVACQFALESDFGRSSLAVNLQNYCGMKKVSRRITSQVSFDGDDNKFGQYNSLYECLIDYGFWLAYNHANSYDLSNLDRYTLFLTSHNYCGEKNYIKSIINLLNSFKNV